MVEITFLEQVMDLVEDFVVGKILPQVLMAEVVAVLHMET
jgi:hypothetical protein